MTMPWGRRHSRRIQNIPEPSTLPVRRIGSVADATRPGATSFPAATGKWMYFLLIGGAELGRPLMPPANNTLFSENFDGLIWDPTWMKRSRMPTPGRELPPAGWMVDDSGVPFVADSTRGVTEWEGWSFANKDWWVSDSRGSAAERNSALGQGTVAVADPDEWDKG